MSTTVIQGRPGAGGASLAPWLAELRATVELAVPLIGLQLGQVAILTTDVMMIGRLGPASLAAASLGMTLFHVTWLSCLGVLVSTAALVAQAKGARNPRGVRRTVRQGLWAAVAVSLPAMALLWQTEPILLLLAQDPTNAAPAGVYVRAALWGFLGSMGFVVLRCFVSALSRPAAAMVVMLVCVALNVLFNYALIYGRLGFPRLELLGAGIASSLVNTLMFLGLLAFVLRDRRLRRYHILARFWRPDWTRLRAIFRVGLPIGAAILTESGLFAMSKILVGWISTEALAAHAVAIQCATVSFMVPLGLGQAGTVRVGLALGRGDRAGVGRAGWTALALGSAFMLAMATVFWTQPESLVGLFLDLDAPETAVVLPLAVAFLGVAGLFQLFDGAQVVAAHALRGLNDTRVPMLWAAFGYWGLGLSGACLLAFPLGFGGIGVWYGLAIGLAVVAAILVRRFHRRDRLDLLARGMAAAAAD